MDNHSRQPKSVASTLKKSSLSSAREHYNSVLPKRIADRLQPHGFRKALLGETHSPDGNKAFPYDPIWTNKLMLDEFGVGIGLYFRSLKAAIYLLVVVAGINVLSAVKNAEYNPTLSAVHAVNSSASVINPILFYGSVLGAKRESLSALHQGLASLLCCFVFVVFTLLAGFFEEVITDHIKAANITTQDYAIEVVNPPPDIVDPESYQSFFKRFGDVCFVSVVLNNGDLIAELAKRKHLRRKFESFRELTDQQGGDAEWRSLLPKIQKCNENIQKMASRKYRPWKVFVIFNEEDSQRRCLHQLAVSLVDLVTGGIESHEHKFCGWSLIARKAEKPSDVIYETNHHSPIARILHAIASYFLCISVMSIPFAFLKQLQNAGPVYVALVTNLIDSMLPILVKFVTMKVEVLSSHSELQSSFLIKLLIVRCLNSGVMVFLIIRPENMFGADEVQQLVALLFSIALAPIVEALDLNGMFNRKILGKFVKTQKELNDLWQPNDFHLAERYTEFFQIVFLGLMFMVPVPLGLFVCVVALCLRYISDKYILLATSASPVDCDEMASRLVRTLFVAAIFAFCVISRFFFANWPYKDFWTHEVYSAKCGPFTCKVDRYPSRHPVTWWLIELPFFSPISPQWPKNTLLCDTIDSTASLLLSLAPINYRQMTSDQRVIVVIYNVASILFFVVTVCLMLQLIIRDFFGDISIWRRRFKESHSFVETPFRCFARPAEVFVPTGLFATELPIVCSNFWVPPGMVFPDIKIYGVPERKLQGSDRKREDFRDDEDNDIDEESYKADYELLSVVRNEEFPFLDPADWRTQETISALFGTVAYFAPKAVAGQSDKKTNIKKSNSVKMRNVLGEESVSKVAKESIDEDNMTQFAQARQSGVRRMSAHLIFGGEANARVVPHPAHGVNNIEGTNNASSALSREQIREALETNKDALTRLATKTNKRNDTNNKAEVDTAKDSPTSALVEQRRLKQQEEEGRAPGSTQSDSERRAPAPVRESMKASKLMGPPVDDAAQPPSSGALVHRGIVLDSSPGNAEARLPARMPMKASELLG